MPLAQSCMHWGAFWGQAVQGGVCGRTPGTVAARKRFPPFSPCNHVSPVCFCRVSILFVCVYECVFVYVVLKSSFKRSCADHWSFVPSFRCLFLASDLVTVYSNHKMLGIRLVSRTRKYSDIGQAAILGNNGVSTSCVKKNHIMPIVQPATPP